VAVIALIITQLTATQQHFVISCNEFHQNWTIHTEHTGKMEIHLLPEEDYGCHF
jgi:hypothetical protein